MRDNKRANRAFEDGVKALGFRRPNEQGEELDLVRARSSFRNAVETDPGMADAWLGLHAAGEDPGVCLDRMVEHLDRFGEARRLSRRELHSRYLAGRYTRFPLETWEDVMLAQAARWLDAGRLDLCASYLARAPSDRIERALLFGRQLFAAGEYEAMLPVMQALSQQRRIAAEAQLHIGIALARRELFSEADRVLAEATERTDNSDLAMEATYYRGLVFRSLAHPDEARACLEWVYRHNPHYLDVAELLANPSLRLETEPLRPAGQRQNTESLEDLMHELDGQIGLDEVKNQVRAVAAQVHARTLRAERGLPLVGTSNHLVFAGPPGTGKTTVARLVGRIYAALGVLSGTGFVETSRAGLVGEYVGHTAPKTNAKIDEALDGVLFIDEAYSLAQEGSDHGDSYGRESIETLLKRMEDDRDRLVVIIAGYGDKLDWFLNSNPGLRSRFATTIDFRSYHPDELVAIARTFATQSGDQWTGPAVQVLRDAINEAVSREWIDELGNGRFVRNLYEAAARQRDLRLFDLTGQGGDAPTNEQLSTVEEIDIAAAVQEILGSVRRRTAESGDGPAVPDRPVIPEASDPERRES
jgi:tetratricopeptide (TPR) repeat protein